MKNWKTIHFGDIADLRNGLNFLKSDSGEEVKIIGVGDFRQKYIFRDFSDLETVSIKNKLSHQDTLQDGDLLFVRSNGNKRLIGRCLLVFPGSKKVSFSGFSIRARLDISKANPEFVGYFMQSKMAKDQIFKDGSGTNISNLSQEILSKIVMPLPTLPEQQKIAKILATWDEGVGKLERLVEAKKKQFLTLAIKTITNKSFPLKSLKELSGTEIIIKKGRAIQKKDVIFGEIPVIAGGKTSPYFHNRATHSVPSITVSASGANAGYIWFHNKPIWASDCIVIYTNTHLTQYLYYALKIQQHKVYAMQSGGGQPHIYEKDLKKLSISFPSINAQINTINRLTQFEQDIQKLEGSIQLHKIQKQALMQKLLSGEWNTKGD